MSLEHSDEMTALSSCSETHAQTHRRQKVGQRATKIQILVTALPLENHVKWPQCDLIWPSSVAIMDVSRGKGRMAEQEESKPANGRFNTNELTKQIVWIQTAGHCELCGTDLTFDYRAGKPMKWGEVAHILPASPKGPRGRADHDAEAHTNDPANLMLLSAFDSPQRPPMAAEPFR
jgi:hypothetical protein